MASKSESFGWQYRTGRATYRRPDRHKILAAVRGWSAKSQLGPARELELGRLTGARR